jgi:hypothetical protein
VMNSLRGLMLRRNVGAIMLESDCTGFLDFFIVNCLLQKVLDMFRCGRGAGEMFSSSNFCGLGLVPA